MKKIFFNLIRILIGLIFIISAIAKLRSVDTFELYIFSQHIFGFDLSGLVARLVISFEIALGVLLILNLYFKYIYKISIYALLSFSLFLSFKMLFSQEDNCHCFGELIKFNPAESLLKNFIFIVLLFFIKSNKGFSFKYSKWAVVAVCVLSLILPSVISAPDMIYRKIYPVKQNIQGEELLTLTQDSLGFNEGKKVLAFFSMGCHYCILTAQKISIIDDKMGIYDNIFYVFFGDDINLVSFWEHSHSKTFKNVILPFEETLAITRGHYPTVLFVEDGYIKSRTGYRDLTEKQFEFFFTNN